MTQNPYTLDEVHAALAHRLVEDMQDHEDQVSRDLREPDQEPDPEFADMAIETIIQELEDYAMEEASAAWEYEFNRRYPGIL